MAAGVAILETAYHNRVNACARNDAKLAEL
jgi:hypothetical protein